MARATRIALDLALVSLRKVGPVLSKMWMSAKTSVAQTKARSLVCNPLVSTAETAIDKFTNILISSLTSLRDRQLPKEQIYLEKELERVKDRISKRGDSSTSKSLKPVLGVAWQYAKVEMVPPMTQNFFNGPSGKRLEDSVSKSADDFIASLQKRIKDIDAEEQREIKRKEALAKAAQEILKAEAKKKAEEAKKKIAEQLAKAAKDKKKTETEKKPEKTAAVESKPKKADEAKKKETSAKEAKAKQKTESAKKAQPEKKPEKSTTATKKTDEPKKPK